MMKKLRYRLWRWRHRRCYIIDKTFTDFDIDKNLSVEHDEHWCSRHDVVYIERSTWTS